MLPLATVGFFSAGLFFAFYAYTFHALIGKKIPSVLRYFAYAYFSLGIAFMFWGVAAYVGTQNMLQGSVIIGNVLLLLSTFFLLMIYFADNKAKNIVLSAWAVLSVLFIVWRVINFPPAPMLVNGILMFNTQQPVAVILCAIILLTWLPTNLKVARLVTDRIKLEGFSYIYSSIYIMATIAALLFLTAKMTLIITLSFAAIIICFIMLSVSNVVIEKFAK